MLVVFYESVSVVQWLQNSFANQPIGLFGVAHRLSSRVFCHFKFVCLVVVVVFVDVVGGDGFMFQATSSDKNNVFAKRRCILGAGCATIHRFDVIIVNYASIMISGVSHKIQKHSNYDQMCQEQAALQQNDSID